MGRVGSRAASPRTGSAPIHLRYLFMLATAFGITYLILFTSDTTLKSSDIFLPWKDVHHNDLSTSEEKFTIQTKGCSIPSLKPFDDAVKTFVKYPTFENACPDPKFSLLSSNLTHIWIQEENKGYHNITQNDNFTCCYQSFFRPKRIDDITSSNNDDRVEYSECKQFDGIIKANDEFGRVVCGVKGVLVYQQYFLFFKKKQPPFPESINASDNNSLAYNVVVMGIDAVSRLNFHRTMPKTLAYLKKIGAIEMLGYNKVGDNTFPNVIPMLMGISEPELKTTCIPRKKSSFDNCPFIWEWFNEKGYHTAFGEDSSSLGTFNYLKPGFLRSPVDYYIHTFINEAEKNVGINKDFNSYLCMNEKYFYEVLLDYVDNLLKTLRFSKVFGFFWEVTMSHDYLNYPMLIDNKYESFLKSLDESKVFDDTLLILVSDHGIRWGDIRLTKQGRLEERLPFVYILLPESFREKYDEAYRNLILNSKRLTTPYDLHATLVDLVDTTNIENEVINTRKNQSYAQKRGISLFLPVPMNRTCEMANIDDHWCTCLRSHNLPTNNTEAIEVAVQLEGIINRLIQRHSQCARLKLADILEVNEMEVRYSEDNEIGWREFMVVIRTSPGDGVFEATLRHDTQQWVLKGTVSRLNLYGNRSRCVHNYQLKLYCFCH